MFARLMFLVVMRTCSGLFSTDMISTPEGEFLAISMAEYPYRAPTSRIRFGRVFFTISARILPLTGPIDGMNERCPIASMSLRTASAGSNDFFYHLKQEFPFYYLVVHRSCRCEFVEG